MSNVPTVEAKLRSKKDRGRSIARYEDNAIDIQTMYDNALLHLCPRNKLDSQRIKYML